ncbi:hypothetical protein BOTBODRAFT_186196 [Botryobasidium botryosum FD-172 SS1]|uniref:C2H2-type domain-containing protein n=1 Tax=Botryobasidium botryosum (strain FD-172 SS1) TaxID=930990 RepID=A0A067MZR5_BOTB1|nr:hypothetical protein BOTBODRAFT_186196 [Botryobasidium botryosum FD-172 SS1]
MKHQCSSCPKAFKNSSRLRRHVNDCHTKEIQYKCPKCSKTVTQRPNLKSHMKVHEKKVPSATTCPPVPVVKPVKPASPQLAKALPEISSELYRKRSLSTKGNPINTLEPPECLTPSSNYRNDFGSASNSPPYQHYYEAHTRNKRIALEQQSYHFGNTQQHLHPVNGSVHPTASLYGPQPFTTSQPAPYALKDYINITPLPGPWGPQEHCPRDFQDSVPRGKRNYNECIPHPTYPPMPLVEPHFRASPNPSQCFSRSSSAGNISKVAAIYENLTVNPALLPLHARHHDSGWDYPNPIGTPPEFGCAQYCVPSTQHASSSVIGSSLSSDLSLIPCPPQHNGNIRTPDFTAAPMVHGRFPPVFPSQSQVPPYYRMESIKEAMDGSEMKGLRG